MATTSLRRVCVTRLRRAQLHQIILHPWGDVVAGRHHELGAAALRRLVIVPLAAWPVARLPVTGRSER
jgi:hypothetical protein